MAIQWKVHEFQAPASFIPVGFCSSATVSGYIVYKLNQLPRKTTMYLNKPHSLLLSLFAYLLVGIDQSKAMAPAQKPEELKFTDIQKPIVNYPVNSY